MGNKVSRKEKEALVTFICNSYSPPYEFLYLPYLDALNALCDEKGYRFPDGVSLRFTNGSVRIGVTRVDINGRMGARDIVHFHLRQTQVGFIVILLDHCAISNSDKKEVTAYKVEGITSHPGLDKATILVVVLPYSETEEEPKTVEDKVGDVEDSTETAKSPPTDEDMVKDVADFFEENGLVLKKQNLQIMMAEGTEAKTMEKVLQMAATELTEHENPKSSGSTGKVSTLTKFKEIVKSHLTM